MRISEVDCTTCHGHGIVISDRIGKSVRCSCMAGRQLAQQEQTFSMASVAALVKRKEVRR